MKITKENILELLKLLIPFTRKSVESKMVMSFINTGNVLLITGLTSPIWDSVILGLSDKYLGTNLAQSNTTVTIVLILIALLSWTIGIIFYWQAIYKQKKPKSKSLSIYQQIGRAHV